MGQPALMVDAIASDGVVTLRPPGEGDAAVLIKGRDTDSERWLGPGSSDPAPTACIIVDEEIVGWVDFDVDRDWPEPGEVNIGYNVFAEYRRRRCATRAVALLVAHLARTTPYRTATLLINADNAGSLAVATSLGSNSHGDIDGSQYFKISIRRAED